MKQEEDGITSKVDILRRKTIGIGEVLLSIKEHDKKVCSPLLYLLENEVYVYVYCIDFGTFAYGNTIDAASDNLASAIDVNIKELHRENRIGDLNDNPLQLEYLEAYQIAKRLYDKDSIHKIVERSLEPENTKIIRTAVKRPPVWEITDTVELSISSIALARVA